MTVADVHQLYQYRGMGETDAPLHPGEEAGVLFDNFGRVRATETAKEELEKAIAGGDVKKIKHWQEMVCFREIDEERYQADVAAGWYYDDAQHAIHSADPCPIATEAQ